MIHPRVLKITSAYRGGGLQLHGHLLRFKLANMIYSKYPTVTYLQGSNIPLTFIKISTKFQPIISGCSLEIIQKTRVMVHSFELTDLNF